MPGYWFISFTSGGCHPTSTRRFVYSNFHWSMAVFKQIAEAEK